MQKTYGIHWFRRDLRVAGNRGLRFNWKRNEGRVLGVFCFDHKFLSRPDFSVNRFQLFLNTLKDLQDELRELGSDLLFMDVGPQQTFPKLFESLPSLPSLITWGRDYEPFARQRDLEMEEFFRSQSVQTKTFRDHLLIEPHELSKTMGEVDPYKVYSPFARKWLQIFQDSDVQQRVTHQKEGINYLERRMAGKEKRKLFDLSAEDLLGENFADKHNLEKYLDSNGAKTDVPIPKAGSLQAFEILKSFESRISEYGDKRDFPQLNGTSKLSMFLKNGSITVPQIISFFNLQPYKKKKSGEDTYFSELIWREFYYHILYHFPYVENQAFLPQYRDLKWENNEEWFEKWKEGETGFPIVDAGMRELKQTGWMHNRVRMIVASFLTKDLLIDWKWGEKYFMDKLLDGDLAPNNGGWQWAASTGCDPQPYFRIFNPGLQSVKFDPQGVYIKKYIPELKDLEPKLLHQPILDHPTYPSPIIEHAVQRDKALKLYKYEKK